jgi:hypothetical protein
MQTFKNITSALCQLRYLNAHAEELTQWHDFVHIWLDGLF